MCVYQRHLCLPHGVELEARGVSAALEATAGPAAQLFAVAALSAFDPAQAARGSLRVEALVVCGAFVQAGAAVGARRYRCSVAALLLGRVVARAAAFLWKKRRPEVPEHPARQQVLNFSRKCATLRYHSASIDCSNAD